MGSSSSKTVDKSSEEDSSDFIDIEQENGSDELDISAEEDNYPPAPCEKPLQNGLVQTNRPPLSFTSPRKPSVSPSVIYSSRKRQSLDSPRRKPKVINYANAIATALHNINHKAETYETLINDLTSGLETDKEKVYAITLWLSQQDIETGKFQKYKPDTPRGYMHLIQNRRGTFPSFFAQLCRKARIPCVIVSGYSKSASYDVGEMSDDILKQHTNTWNCVFADKIWYIVHPYWVCRGLVGHKLGGYVKIEKDGQAMMQTETASEGQLTKCFNKYYIFTDPSEFVCRNIPVEEQSKWQLLSQPLTFNEYKHKPYVRPEFFKQKLKLQSEHDCLLEAKNGVCHIDFQIQSNDSSNVNFTYELDMKIENNTVTTEQDSQTSNSDNKGNTQGNQVQRSSQDEDQNNNEKINNIVKKEEDENNNIRANIARYVIMMRSGGNQENISFEVRLPKEGIYKFSVFSGREEDWGDDPPLTSSFRLVCDKFDSGNIPHMAPIDPGIVGWGPGPKSIKSGFLMPSHDHGKIEANVKEQIIIQFQVVTKQEIVVNMVHNTIPSEHLKQYFSYEESHADLSERRELTVRTCIPDRDEYALRMGTVDNNRKGTPDYVCNYLLSPKESNTTKREGPVVKLVRKQVKEALVNNDLEEIEYLLKRADKFHLHPDENEEVRLLQRRRDFLEMKKMFHETLLRQNIDAGVRMIMKAEGSPFARVFKSDIAHVKKMIHKLENHDRWPHEIPEKNRFTLTEVSHLTSPPEKAQDVMKAICLLVFDFTDEYMDWTDTQAALKNKQKILNRMREMQEDESKMPTWKTMMSVKHLMESISEETVRRIDNSLTPFYLWVKNILERYEDVESRKLESKRESIVPSLQLQH